MDIISFALAKSKLTNAVSDYLDEHLTNPTDPPIDTSLTIEGAAADAKATGDSLSQLNADITDIQNGVFPTDTVTGSSVSFSDGVQMSAIDISVDIDKSIAGQTEVNVTANSDTVTISLGQTVYGGTLDVTTGQLTITHEFVEMSDLSWSTQSTYVYKADISGKKNATSANAVDDMLCSAYVVASGNIVINKITDKTIGASTSNGRIFVYDSDYSTAAAFKASLSGVYLVYPLETQSTIQLTPTDIDVLTGSNSFSADTGDITVEYHKAINDTIESLSANVNALLTDTENVISENVFDASTLTDGAYINMAGTSGSNSSYAVTDYIAVETDDVVMGWAGPAEGLAFRYVTAYDSSKSVISASGAENVSSYTVPSGVSYVRISGYSRSDGNGINASTARITLTGTDCKVQTYKDASIYDFAKQNYTSAQQMLKYPLTSLPSYVLGALAYKPLGQLSQPYICLVSDDGDADLATYTIPMLQEKGDVPCTFAVMSASTVFDTQTGIDAVVDAVTNHNCEIAQHGGTNWDQYNEYALNAFFDSEEEYWDSLGLTAYGAVCPSHMINDTIRAVAGGRFGCVRTGYNAAELYYGSYCNGPRNNLFGLCSQSVTDSTLAVQTSIIDACITNNWLRIVHWHENSLTDDTKAILEGVIDYALANNVTFVTLKDIPTLV